MTRFSRERGPGGRGMMQRLAAYATKAEIGVNLFALFQP
jgi:hypothetical protein